MSHNSTLFCRTKSPPCVRKKKNGSTKKHTDESHDLNPSYAKEDYQFCVSYLKPVPRVDHLEDSTGKKRTRSLIGAKREKICLPKTLSDDELSTKRLQAVTKRVTNDEQSVNRNRDKLENESSSKLQK